MKKLLITLPESLSSAVGFTLLHSLWQGALLLIVFTVMHFLFKSARSRYLLGMGSLFLQAVISLITFTWIYSPGLAGSSTIALESSHLLLPGEMMGTTRHTLLHSAQSYIAQNHQKFTLFWLLGVAILLFRTAIGLFYTRHLKSAGTKTAETKAHTLLKELCQKLRMDPKIQLLESVKISVPLTIGWLKPVILFPAGMLSGLPADQLEAILAHELAHIKRRDYLFNIVQNVIETFFFFHPAVWAISHRVRAERENCCDDIALQHCQSKLVLASALAEVASFSSRPPFAMAFGARRYTLTDRVKRIVGMNERPAHINWISLSILLSLCMTVWTYAQEKEKPAAPPPVVNTATLPTPVAPLDTIPKTPAELAMEELSGEMSALSNQMSQYSDKMQGLSQKMHTAEMDKLSEEMSKLSEKMASPSEKIGDLAQKIAVLSLELATKKLKKEPTADMEAQLQAKQAEMEEVQKDMETLSEKMTALGKKMEVAQEPLHRLGQEMNRLSEPMDSLGKIMNKKGDEMNRLGEKIREEYEARAKAFSKAIGESGLVKDAGNYEIDINASGAQINGKQLNEADASKLWKIISTHHRAPRDYFELTVNPHCGETA